jgi:gliding motility-associated-like protein
MVVIYPYGYKMLFSIGTQRACYTLVWIPNAFTPNGNGPELNEVFKPHCISCQTTFMKIFNRLSELIHSSPEPRDGTYQGVAVPEGIYIYLMGISITYGTQTRKQYFSGNFQVLKRGCL